MANPPAFDSVWPHRKLYLDPNLDSNNEYLHDGVRWVTNADEANLVSSQTEEGLHAPALDIDFAARLLPSKTPGHYHLYLDTTMPWWRYRILLKVLAWTGIIEPGYYRASVARKQTFLRKNEFL